MMGCRHRERCFYSVFIGDDRVEDKEEWDLKRWQIILRNWNLSEFRVSGNLPIPTPQVQLQVLWVVTPIKGVHNPNRQVVPGISLISSHLPLCSNLHPPFPFLVHNSTICVTQTDTPSHSIATCHIHELKPSTAYIEYSVNKRLSAIPSCSGLEVDI